MECCSEEEQSTPVYPLIYQIWNSTFSHLEGRPSTAPQWARLQLDEVFHRLQFQQSIQSYQNIADAKQWWIKNFLGIRGQKEARWCCSILSCPNQGSYIRVNSMHYCESHRGLVMVYGMRHYCNMCMLFSLLCIKVTGHDIGHKYNYLRRLSVPVVDKRSGELWSATIKTYCNEGFNPKLQTLTYCHQDSKMRYYEDITKKNERVPENTFVWVSGNPLKVTAWVHIEVLNNDKWVALREKQTDEMHRLIMVADDRYIDSSGLAMPCPTRGTGYRSYPNSKKKVTFECDKKNKIRGKTPRKRPSKAKKRKV